MSISVGIFDVLGNAIPGSLYLALAFYLNQQLRLFDDRDLPDAGTTGTLILIAVCSYLAGHIFGAPSKLALDKVPLWRRTTQNIRDEFRSRNPELAGQPYIDADPYTLLAGLRACSPDAAMSVERMRAIGIMLRTACPALVLFAITLSVASNWTAEPLSAFGTTITVGAAAMLSLREGRRFSAAAILMTLESAAWLRGTDAYFNHLDDYHYRLSASTVSDR